MSENSVEKLVLENGATILLEHAPHFQSTAIALSFQGGVRDELESEIGVTHLLEHILFKRTGTKDTRQIAERIDELGGEINAFTDSDSFCLYGVVPHAESSGLLELFEEMVRDSRFTTEDLELEKRIIVQEIKDSLDNPQENIYLQFRSQLWKGHPLSRPVAGTVESVESLTKAAAERRLQEVCCGRRAHLAVAGQFNREVLLASATKLLGALPAGTTLERSAPQFSSGRNLVPHPAQQVTLYLGARFPSVTDPDYLAALVMTSLLGQGSSAYLFQSLRETSGICYDIDASLESHLDVGVLVIGGSFARENTAQAVEMIHQELQRFTESRVPQIDFERHRKMMLAQLEMEEDSVRSRVWRTLESELAFGRYIPLGEIRDRLLHLTLDDINQISRQYLKDAPELLVLGGDVKGLKISG